MSISTNLILIGLVLATTIAYAIEAEIIKHDYLPITVIFEHIAIESNIAKFKDYLALIATFVITLHEEDYQLERVYDYVILLAEFVYDIHDPTINTISTHTSNIDITSDMKIEKQDSITINRYTIMNVQFAVDVNVEGDNSI